MTDTNTQATEQTSQSPQELTPEQRQQAELAWQRESFQNAQKHLAEKGILPKTIIEKDSRFLAPFFGIWKMRAQNGKTYWVITGNLPSDHAEVSAAKTAREAVRYFSFQWQVKAQQIMQNPVQDKTQVDFANLLVNRAHGLYEFFEKDELWKNEPA